MEYLSLLVPAGMLFVFSLSVNTYMARCADILLALLLRLAFETVIHWMSGVNEHWNVSLLPRIERKYCLISPSYFPGLFDIFILLERSLCVLVTLLPTRTLRDAYHKGFESH